MTHSQSFFSWLHYPIFHGCYQLFNNIILLFFSNFYSIWATVRQDLTLIPDPHSANISQKTTVPVPVNALNRYPGFAKMCNQAPFEVNLKRNYA